MKIRLLLALTGLAFGSALPILAQEQNAAPNRVRPVDPQDHQQIEAVFMKFQEACNKRDAVAVAALHK